MSKGPTAKQSTPAKKVRTAKRQELVHYLVKVTGWNYYYALRSGDPKNSLDKSAYQELTTVTFSGELIEPKLPKIDCAEMTYSARAGMLSEPLGDTQATIGTVSAHEGKLSGYIFTPQERMAELVTVAQSGRVQIVRFTGSKLRYGSALILSVSLSTEVENDETSAE